MISAAIVQTTVGSSSLFDIMGEVERGEKSASIGGRNAKSAQEPGTFPSLVHAKVCRFENVLSATFVCRFSLYAGERAVSGY